MDTQSGPLDAKRRSFVTVTAEDEVHRFSHILVHFQLGVPGGNIWTEEYACFTFLPFVNPLGRKLFPHLCVSSIDLGE